MKIYCLAIVLTACAVTAHNPFNGAYIWTDILTCVNDLANITSHLKQNSSSGNIKQSFLDKEQSNGDFSMMKLLSIICGDKNGFVECLDSSLKKNNDSMTQIIGSFFDPTLVTQAYEGLCANISIIEKNGVDALNCLSTMKMSSCQNEMADYFFYMGVVKKFAPPSEQLSRNTMETLLCSVSFQRRQCEVQVLRKCNGNLADIMEQFYRQTQPASCAELDNNHERDSDNKIE